MANIILRITIHPHWLGRGHVTHFPNFEALTLHYSRDSPSAVLSETVATLSLSTGINRCRHTETVLYAPRSGGRRPSR